jgi:GDP-mannose 6-dehydrogenase
MSAKHVYCIGLGRVGLILALQLDNLGLKVFGIEKNSKVLKDLNSKKSPFVEPDIEKIIKKNTISFRKDLPLKVENNAIIIICVGTPLGPSGKANISDVLKATKDAQKTIKNSSGKQCLIIKSTIPCGTIHEKILPIIGEIFFEKNALFHHPEFLREGKAFQDLVNPSLNVVGSLGSKIKKSDLKYLQIFPGFEKLKIVDYKTSEMIKYMNNTFHALKVSFANEFSSYSKELGVNTDELFELFLSDKKLNISGQYLNPGFSFGGSCLTKDVSVIKNRKSKSKLPLIDSILKSNQAHTDRLESLIKSTKAKRILFCGMTFKSGTDDIRESPIYEIAKAFSKLRAYKVGLIDFPSVLDKTDSQKITQHLRFEPSLYELIVLGPYKLKKNEIAQIVQSNCMVIDLLMHKNAQKISNHPGYMRYV